MDFLFSLDWNAVLFGLIVPITGILGGGCGVLLVKGSMGEFCWVFPCVIVNYIIVVNIR